MKNIVILGAGFAGLKTALKLEKGLSKLHDEWSIILIDRNSFHTYTASLYEAASAYRVPRFRDFESLLGSSTCLSIESIIGKKRIAFVKQEIRDINFIEKKVATSDGGAIPFEYLVFALGSETSHFNIPGAAQCCYSLKSLRDALDIRKRIEEIFKNNNGERITIIMAGAGATGVETIAEIAKYAGHLAKDYKINRSLVSISLLEAQDKILPYFAHALRSAVQKRLKKLGIEALTGAKISAVMATCAILASGRKCEADIILWSGGIKGPALFSALTSIQLDKNGRVIVNKFLQINETVFAIGDNALFTDEKSGNPAPAAAFIAEQQADITAGNIISSMRGLPLAEFTPSIPGYVISCGGKYAVVNIYGVTFSGFFGWAVKRLIDLKYFMSVLPLYKALSLWFKEMSLFTKND